VLAFCALAALAATSMRAGATRMEDLVALVVIASIAVITLAGTLLDWGIAGPGFGFLGLMTCMVCAVAGLRLGSLVAALSAAVVVCLAYAQYRHWLPGGNAAVSNESLGLRTLVHLIVIGSGLGIHGGSADGAMAAIVSGVCSALYVKYQQRFHGYIKNNVWHPGVLRGRDPRLGAQP
jgi:hypothetical protein